IIYLATIRWLGFSPETPRSSTAFKSRGRRPGALTWSQWRRISRYPFRAIEYRFAMRRSMRHAVDEVIDAELVRFVRLIDRAKAGARPLPELRHVGVVVDDDLQALVRVVVLEHAPEDRLAGVVGLRHVGRVVDLEERVENRMGRLHVIKAHAGKHSTHIRLERLPPGAAEVARPLEIVDDEEPAFLQV